MSRVPAIENSPHMVPWARERQGGKRTQAAVPRGSQVPFQPQPLGQVGSRVLPTAAVGYWALLKPLSTIWGREGASNPGLQSHRHCWHKGRGAGLRRVESLLLSSVCSLAPAPSHCWGPSSPRSAGWVESRGSGDTRHVSIVPFCFFSSRLLTVLPWGGEWLR